MKSTTTLSEADLQKVREAAKLIEANLKHHYTIPELAEKVTLNVKKLKQGFQELYHMGAYKYLLQVRIEKACDLLLQGHTVRAAAIATGFKGHTGTTNFIRSFKRVFDISPGVWTRQQLNQHKGGDSKTG